MSLGLIIKFERTSFERNIATTKVFHRKKGVQLLRYRVQRRLKIHTRFSVLRHFPQIAAINSFLNDDPVVPNIEQKMVVKKKKEEKKFINKTLC